MRAPSARSAPAPSTDSPPSTGAGRRLFRVYRAALVDVEGDFLAVLVDGRADPIGAVLVQPGDIGVALLIQQPGDLVLIQRRGANIAGLHMLAPECRACAERSEERECHHDDLEHIRTAIDCSLTGLQMEQFAFRG